ncbi:hypothetical protein BGW38_001959 [Lunasporangiospora selenospora]|uniref:P-loop containing nucleoside triphosphate hydrolase protein n=1 Tax=Lunasporangiospora selenospora TaxID=979761 RepID=A0A9P6G1Y7_9FUNG|nr:hypothetical protein BGW38_001959 [Lunasporangiospora selenospora]
MGSAIHTLYDLEYTRQPIFPLCAASLAFLLLAFIVEAWPRGSTRVQQLSRAQEFEKANLFSQLTFHFFQPIVTLAARQRMLQPSDIVNQLPKDHTTNLGYSRVSSVWNRRLERFKASRHANDPKKGPSLLATIIITYRWSLIPVISLMSLIPFAEFLSPVLLAYLLDYVERSSTEEAQPLSIGLVLAFSIAGSYLISCFMHGYTLREIVYIGTEIKSALIAMVYRKALRLSPEARRKSSTGAIMNHMAVDAEIWDYAMDMLASWVLIPIQLSIAFYLLYGLLGWSFSAGVLTFIAMIPLQVWRASIYEGLEDRRLKSTDERVRVTSEVLSSIKIVKLYGWELPFKSKILAARMAELKVLKQLGALEAVMTLVFASSSLIVSLVTFTVYVTIAHGELTPKTVFVSMSLFDLLHEPMTRLAEATTDTISIVVSTKRIQRFLLREEIDESQVCRLPRYESDDNDKPAIEVKNATMSWDSGKTEEDVDEDDDEDEDEDDQEEGERRPLLAGQEEGGRYGESSPEARPPVLQDLSFSIRDGSLVAIVGRVGQGKSSLLSALIGEMYRMEGSITVRGRLAYVPQQAWIVNATLRDNILFGKEMDQERYRQVLQVCGLEPDLAILPAGDMTEIGERGINLSGGQKQRVSLARAAYDDADIYLFDDPLSAVDAHVDRHLWDNLIGPNGMLRDKTRLLVTHGIHHVGHVDEIMVLKNGQIAEMGKYEQLLSAKQSFYQLIREYAAKHTKRRRSSHAVVQSTAAAVAAETPSSPIPRTDSPQLVSDEEFSDESGRESDNVTIEDSSEDAEAKKKLDDMDDALEQEEDELIAEEIMKKGGIEWKLVKNYTKAVGVPISIAIVLINVVTEICYVGISLWLKHWIDKSQEELSASIVLFLAVYAGLTMIFATFYVLWVYLIFAVARIRASELIHERLISTIIRLPMSFFDTTPLGRIINRFSSDCYSTDEHLPWKFLDLIYLTNSVISTFIVVSVSTPKFLFVIPVMALVFYTIQRYFLWATRSLKRIKSISVSPLYQHFDESLNGVSVIRAMKIQQQFVDENAKRSDYSANAMTAYTYCNRWVEIRLQMLSVMVILSVALLAVFGRRTLSPSLVGLTMSYVLSITDNITWLVRDYSEWQSHLVAIERIQEYTDKRTEAPEMTEKGATLPDHWPAQGRVVFKDYSTRYREGLDLVIKHVSIEVKPREKIGIVGRTGAGKSSLTLALFRIIEAANSYWARASDNSDYHRDEHGELRPDEQIPGGSIEIDGVDISTLGLTDLRKHLAIIPQEPTLFAGTLRDNLDPFQERTDTELWEALERAHLKDFVRGLPDGGLSYTVAQNGENFSLGQRSLLCLARALLRKSKILILDEATASVDMETDELIQRTIREEFADRTILTIAHRIKTVMDSDRILVLEQGEVVEFDSPQTLLQNPESLFFKLAHQAGEVVM